MHGFVLTLTGFLSILQVKEYLEGEIDEIPEKIEETGRRLCRSDEVCAGLEYVASKLRADLECKPLTCSSDFETIIENSGGGGGGGGGNGGGGQNDLEASSNLTTEMLPGGQTGFYPDN